MQQQKKILDYIEEGKSYNWIGEQTFTTKSTISKIKSRKAKILASLENSASCSQLKKIRQVSHPDVEKVVFYWFMQQREAKLPISINLLQQQGKKFHSQMCKITNCKFNASPGWVQKFQRRHGIRILKITGEKLSADVSAVAPFREQIVNKIVEMDLTLAQVYNADESGLYFRMLPTTTMVASDEREAPGKKQSKESHVHAVLQR